MSLIRKIYPVAIAVALIAGATYMIKSQFATTSSAPQLTDQSDENTGEENTTPVIEATTTSQDNSETAAVVEATDITAKESPFTVVETTGDVDTESNEDTTEPKTDNISETSVDNNDNSNNETISTSRSSTTSIVVPDSYSIEDADKYFIPKDQRGPGNLGGPPPLNFPGGPNDPNFKLPTE